MVGPYRMLTRLGEGGMGVVHLGQAADGRRLAVKVLRPHVVGDDEARDRLAREVNSLSRVRSPRVAEIIDADPYGPIPYVATRYVPGLVLSDHVKHEGAIAGADLTWFARALAEALDAVHAAGVLHRDIKPSNVLMEGRTPVLIDFGLARVADDVRLTRTGWLLGTPGYIAPETLHGEDPTTAADVHGWAATVAFAGTGRAPFGRGPSMAIMDRVRRGQHDLGGLDPRMLPLVTRGLDPDPSRRPPLAEVLHALGAVPTSPRAPIDDVPHTQPHDLESLLWSLGPDATTRLDDLPTRGYDDDPAAYPDPAPNHQPYQTPPPADRGPIAPDPAEPYGADWIPASWEDQPQRPSAAERLRRGLLGITVLAGVGTVAVVAPYLTAIALAVLVVLARGLSLTGARATDRRGLRGSRWYDVLLTPLTAPWFLLASLPGTGLLLAWAVLLAGSAVLVLVALGAGLGWALFSLGALTGLVLWTGPGAARLRSPVRRLTHPLARSGRSWAVATAVLLALVVGGVLTVDGRGVDWSPAQGSPTLDGSWFGRLV